MASPNWELIHATIIAEAAGETYEAKVGIAEAIRNRGWSVSGFAGSRRKDLEQFVARQSEAVRRDASKALAAAQGGSQYVQGSTIALGYPLDFNPPPRWLSKCKHTATFGNIKFYSEP